MADNDATVESLDVTQVRLVKDGKAVKVNVDYKIGMLINEHLTSFTKGKTLDLPKNLQTDAENLWDDLYEHLRNSFDLALEQDDA